MLLIISFGALQTSAQAQSANDFTRYSLEDLLSIEATSVAKKRQRISDTSAAVFVITQEDIVRSGAHSVPDILRMVPGVEVGAIDGISTAVSMRGFNSRFANSVLVLVDGRAIYVAAVSGVLWDQLLDPIDTIERIEVVRGPGSTVWGANAVNGIINIITKDASHTSGGAGQVRIGADGNNVALRAGGGNDTTRFRLTATGRTTLAQVALGNDARASIRSRGGQLGGQVDIAPNNIDAVTMRMTAALGEYGGADDVRRSGIADGHYRELMALGRWSRRVSDAADFILQSYVDHVFRHEGLIDIRETLIDLEGNARYASGREEVGAGINLRFTDDHLESSSATFGFIRPALRDTLVGGYLQNDHWFIPDRLKITIGSKVEHSNVSGFAVEPSVRMLGHPNPQTTVWASWSRAVRTPAMFERNATLSIQAGPDKQAFQSPIPVFVNAAGSEKLRSARLDAFEAGARLNVAAWLSVDIAGYRNFYRDLVGLAPTTIAIMPPFTSGMSGAAGGTGGLPIVRAEYRILNNSKAGTAGIEISAAAVVSDRVKLDLYGSLIDTSYDVGTNLQTVIPGLPAGIAYSLPLIPQPGLVTTPRVQGGIRSRIDLLPTLELDSWLRHVGPLKRAGVASYTTMDVRLAWHFNNRLLLAITGRNLFAKDRVEFLDSLITSAPMIVQRRVSAAISARL